MKKLLFLFSLFILGLNLCAQEIAPDWVHLRLPKPTNETFFYQLITIEHVSSRYEAEKEAERQAYLKGAQNLGIWVNPSTMKIDEMEKKVALRMRCSYVEVKNGKTIYYFLYQISNSGRVVPRFDDCDCYDSSLGSKKIVKNTNIMIGYSFVPGMAQIKKGSIVKGSCFIAGEVVFIGGIVVTECLRRNYAQQIAMTNNTALKQRFAYNANVCMISRNVCIAGAAALYVWNVIDGIVAKDRRQMYLGDVQLDFVPYATPYEGGLAFNLNF